MRRMCCSIRAAVRHGRSHNSTPCPRQATLLAAAPANNNQFGFSTALSRDGITAFVGAPGTGNYTGSVFACTSSAGVWSVPQIVGTGGVTGVLLGEGLAADGAGDYVLA